jgi:hypothetical protein
LTWFDSITAGAKDKLRLAAEVVDKSNGPMCEIRLTPLLQAVARIE